MTPQPESALPGRRRVLFVEDEVALQHTYRRYFANRYQLAFARTGAAALDQFEGFHPDVVVMDLHLPDTDGIEVMRQMRSARGTVPIVITSGYASLRPLVDVLGLAHAGFLVKPFELDALAACIDGAR